MKTDDLIKALVADNGTVERPISRTVLLALAAGILLSASTFMALLHIRPDFADAIVHEPRFLFKFIFTLTLGAASWPLVRRLARPDGEASRVLPLLIVPLVLLIAAVCLEMLSVPAASWPMHALGSMPGACMKYIPILSTAPLAAFLVALRHGAPTHPAAAGAAAGLLAGAIGATLYASFCIDDSPMFLAIWYVLGLTIVTAAGAALGAWLLKW
mgnify:CR=1 FL=1